MNVQILKNKNGHKIGTIKDDGRIQSIFDKNGHKLGEYKKNQDITYNKNGHKIGKGNLLSTLLVP